MFTALVIVVCVIALGLFIVGRGATRTTAEVIDLGDRTIRATPVVTAKALVGTAKAAKVAGRNTKVITAKTGHVTRNTVNAARSGVRTFAFDTKIELARVRQEREESSDAPRALRVAGERASRSA